MTSNELRRYQHELGLTGEEMAKELGMSARAYYYRLSGELPIKTTEARTIDMMVAAHRMAAAKGKRP